MQLHGHCRQLGGYGSRKGFVKWSGVFETQSSGRQFSTMFCKDLSILTCLFARWYVPETAGVIFPSTSWLVSIYIVCIHLSDLMCYVLHIHTFTPYISLSISLCHVQHPNCHFSSHLNIQSSPSQCLLSTCLIQAT